MTTYTTGNVNTWFQTIDGLPSTTTPISTVQSTAYVAALNATPPTQTVAQVQATLENFPFNPSPPPTNIATDVFYRTTVADFVLAEFQLAWGVVPTTGTGSEYQNWVLRIIADPSLESGGGMSQALAGTTEFMTLFGTSSATQLATVGFVNQICANCGLTPGAGAYMNVGLPVWQVLQNFASAPGVMAHLDSYMANFQNLLLDSETPTGSILTLPNPGQATFTLTVGIDNISTGVANATFSAPIGQNPTTLLPADTLNTGDIINDTGTGGVLNATFAATAGTLVQATISGIPTFNLTNLGGPHGINGGTVTGLTTINDTGSIASIAVGTAASPLPTAVSTIGMSNTSTALTVQESVAALAGTSDAIVINAANVGLGGVAVVAVGSGAANGVESWTVNSSSTQTGGNFLELGALSGTSATTLTVTDNGTGPIQLSADNAASFENVTSIVATAASGGVTITGASSPGAGLAGLLTDNTVLTSAVFAAGDNSIDVSNMTIPEVTALTATGGTGTNTIILSDAVLTGATSTTFALVTEFQIIGDSGAGGTIDWSVMPVGSDELQYVNAQTAAITIDNAPSSFTLDTGHFGGLFGAETVSFASTTSTTNSFTLVLGDTTGTSVAGNPFDVNGAGVVTIEANGPSATSINFMDGFAEANTFTANAGGGVAMTVDGDASLVSNAMFFVGTGASTITATQTGTLELDSYSGGIFNPGAGVTNASIVNASASGGLWMEAADVGNNGTTGVSITGSATAANALSGSAGNDNITGGAGGGVIITQGGGDAITLTAGTNHPTNVDLFVGNGTGFAPITFDPFPSSPFGNYFAVPASIVSGADLAHPGFWGVAPGAAPTTIAASTSLDQSVVTNFIAGSGANQDNVALSVGSWGAAPGFLGLVGVDLITAPVAVTDAVLTAPVASGSTLTGTGVGSPDVVVLTGSTFANAATLATDLQNGTFALTFSKALTANNVAHILFAYNDGSGNAHIADVDLQTGTTAHAAAANMAHIYASDMVQLTGVSDLSLVGSNIHFVG